MLFYVQMHHVLYEDGESEWVCLPREAHAWVPGLQSAAYPAGLPPGKPQPSFRPFCDIKSTQLQQCISCLALLQVCVTEGLRCKDPLYYGSGTASRLLLP